jgi:hypothetical protein
VDLQRVRDEETQVASGAYSGILHGRYNAAPGEYSRAGGRESIAHGQFSTAEGEWSEAQAQYSQALGAHAWARHTGEYTRSVSGFAQYSTLILECMTNFDGSAEFSLGGVSGGERFSIPNDRAVACSIMYQLFGAEIESITSPNPGSYQYAPAGFGWLTFSYDGDSSYSLNGDTNPRTIGGIFNTGVEVAISNSDNELTVTATGHIDVEFFRWIMVLHVALINDFISGIPPPS